jgi:hypothetical protein
MEALAMPMGLCQPDAAAPAGPLEQRECLFMGVEHHLLRLTRMGSHEH